MRILIIIFSVCFQFAFGSTMAVAYSPDNDGQYFNLKRSYECRRDRRQYGNFYNYGYWAGGRWCGRTMPAGYYVYQDGIWYVWADRRAAPPRLDAGEQNEAAEQTGE